MVFFSTPSEHAGQNEAGFMWRRLGLLFKQANTRQRMCAVDEVHLLFNVPSSF